MSNLIPANIQVPAHIAKRMGQPSALATAIMGGIGGGESFPRISIKGSRFRIKDGDAETVLETTALDVITVGANPHPSKTYYASDWDPNAEPAAPDCYSLNGVRPNPDVAEPQNDICATCEWNKFGSAKNGNGKRCADKKRLAVVAADDPTGPIYLLEVTATAMKSLNVYQKELIMRGMGPEVVRTRVSFDTDATYPKLQFGFGGFLDEETIDAVAPLFNSDKVKEITGESASAAVAAIPAPKEAPKPVLVKAAAKPEPVQVEEAEAEEAPKPIRGFGAAKAKPVAQEPAKPKAAAKVAPVKAESVSDIADEIAGLLGEMDADDA
jgi:hypothetical protein